MVSRSDASRFRDQFFARHPQAESVMELFEYLPATSFYAKDTESRFVRVNSLFLNYHGLTHKWEAWGKTDRDFHPPAMAEAYIAEDRRVMKGGVAIPGQVWLVLDHNRRPQWYSSSKIPLRDINGEVIGLAGAMYRITEPADQARYHQEMAPVIAHIEEHYAESVSMGDLAEMVGLSATHFNRRFKQLLHMTPTRFLLTVRVQAAQSLLATTLRSASEVALATGFCDQSHFTHRFRSVTGMTPLAYRKRFRRD